MKRGGRVVDTIVTPYRDSEPCAVCVIESHLMRQFAPRENLMVNYSTTTVFGTPVCLLHGHRLLVAGLGGALNGAVDHVMPYTAGVRDRVRHESEQS